MKRYLLLILATLTLAAAGDYVVKKSPYSVDRTVERFKAIIAKKGFTLFSVIDHKANAESAGLTMPELKVVIFGNPKGGTLLMQKDPRMGLELPLKVAVYQDSEGVKLIYKNPEAYSDAFKVKGHKVIEKMIVGLDRLTSAAVN